MIESQKNEYRNAALDKGEEYYVYEGYEPEWE